MVDFKNKLKKLRNERNITQQNLADRLGITKSMISAYETSIRYPSYDVLIKIASLFKVSTDYLLGLDNKRTISLDKLTDNQTKIVSNLVEEFLKSKE